MRACVLVGAAAIALAAGQRAEAGPGTTVRTITDPALGATAFTVRVPVGWRFEGTVLPGPPCDEIPYPVYRAYSTDGLTEMRMLPRFNWSFSNGTNAPSNQCLPLGRTLTATEFLRYLAGTMNARYAGDMTVSPRVRERTGAFLTNLQRASATIPGYRATGSIAAVRVRTTNGTFTIEQRLRAWVVCHSQPFFGGHAITGCFARVDVLRAPAGRLDALAAETDAVDLNTATADRDYTLRLAQLLQARGNARIAAMNRHNDEVMAAQKARFEQSMAVQRHAHEQFMAQLQSSTDSSMRNANAAMNARSTATSDWVDYALDRQTVTGSGGTAKVSSAYAHTWADGAGHWYQTNDANANPNGVLGGTWTQQTRVHGNGTSLAH